MRSKKDAWRPPTQTHVGAQGDPHLLRAPPVMYFPSNAKLYGFRHERDIVDINCMFQVCCVGPAMTSGIPHGWRTTRRSHGYSMVDALLSTIAEENLVAGLFEHKSPLQDHVWCV